MSLDSYESAVDTQMIDAREIEIETCAYKDCGYLFVDIQCHYWQYHPQFIKPNTNQANLTNEKVTEKEFPEVQIAHKRSNQSEDTESVKAAKHQPQKQDDLSDHIDGLPTKEEQKPLTETVMCNPDPNAVWSAEALSPTKATMAWRQKLSTTMTLTQRKKRMLTIRMKTMGPEVTRVKKERKKFLKE